MKKHRPKPRPRRKPFAQGGRAFKREARQDRYRREGMAIVKATLRARQSEIDMAVMLTDDDPLGLEGY